MEGTPFGRYLLVELLGRGGMGEVWRAHDTVTDRIVAVKLLPPGLAADDTFQQRFRREAHAAARLNEPHVVPIHGYGEIDGRLYVDMRLIEGRDLAGMVRDDGPLRPARAVAIVEQIAKALNAAHRVGLIHRDVKPSNILVAEYDFAYLIDFGIARAVDEAGLTSTGGMMGTWQYMAPERLNSDHVDARADVYALCCVLHECLTGSRPFPGETLERQVAGHLSQPPPRPSEVHPGVPESFDAVIARGMAKVPDDRFGSTLELAEAARDALSEPQERQQFTAPPTVADPLPVPERPERPGHRRRSPALMIGLAAALLIAAVVVAVVFVVADRGDDPVAATTTPPPGTTTTTPPSAVAAALTGRWSGPVSGDQSGFDVVADIVDGPSPSAVVDYPQLGCTGTWTQKGSAPDGGLLFTETITRGTCVTSEVTLTPKSDGTLAYSSTFFSTSQQQNLTIRADLRRVPS